MMKKSSVTYFLPEWKKKLIKKYNNISERVYDVFSIRIRY